MRYLIITIALLAISVGLKAQEVTVEKQQRWYFTAQFGLDTYPGFSSGNGADGSKLLLSELGYRLHRHLDVGLQLGFMGQATSGFSEIETVAFSDERFMTSWNSQLKHIFVGLQAKLNYRIGQGDLSMGVTFGMLRHSNSLEVKSPQPFLAELKMAPILHGYHNVQIGYTYWASNKFGLMVGFSIFTLDIGNNTQNLAYSQGGAAFYTISDSVVEGIEVEDDSFMALRYLRDNGTTHYLTLGLTARIF